MEKHVETDLLEIVEAFIAKAEMTKTHFGKQAVGDGNLVAQLKKGRELRRRTREKVLSFIGSHPVGMPDVSCLNSIVSENETKINFRNSIPSGGAA